MRVSRLLLAPVLCVALVLYAQGNTFDKIRYNGGTVATTVKPKEWDNRLTVTSDLIKLELKDGQKLEIDPASVKMLSYGQEAHRRVGTFVALGILVAPLALFGLFHKTRLHYVGVEYTTEEGKPSALLLQAHKKNYRAVLMALRGATGAPVSVAEQDRKFVPTGIETVEGRPTAAESMEAADAPEEENLEAEAATGTCLVTSEPESAEVSVDGAFVGNTPAKLTLTPGKHTIRVWLEGYGDWEREISVLPNSEVVLKATLKAESQM